MPNSILQMACSDVESIPTDRYRRVYCAVADMNGLTVRVGNPEVLERVDTLRMTNRCGKPS